jgi:integrase
MRNWAYLGCPSGTMFKKLALKAHIFRDLYPHALRATAATMLAYEKISAPTLKYIMGWSSLQAAEDYVKSDMHLAHSEIRKIYGSRSEN